jgi:hypothetical protein
VPTVPRVQVILCEHCGKSIQVAPGRQPVSYIEREANGQRAFLIIDVDNWLLHQCVIAASGRK